MEARFTRTFFASGGFVLSRSRCLRSKFKALARHYTCIISFRNLVYASEPDDYSGVLVIYADMLELAIISFRLRWQAGRRSGNHLVVHTLIRGKPTTYHDE